MPCLSTGVSGRPDVPAMVSPLRREVATDGALYPEVGRELDAEVQPTVAIEVDAVVRVRRHPLPRATSHRHPRHPPPVARIQRPDAAMQLVPAELLHLQCERSLQPVLAAHAPCLLRVQVERARGRRCRRLHLSAQRIPRRAKLVGRARGPA